MKSLPDLISSLTSNNKGVSLSTEVFLILCPLRFIASPQSTSLIFLLSFLPSSVPPKGYVSRVCSPGCGLCSPSWESWVVTMRNLTMELSLSVKQNSLKGVYWIELWAWSFYDSLLIAICIQTPKLKPEMVSFRDELFLAGHAFILHRVLHL